MSTIKADLVGVIHLPDGRMLKAGDEVPEGVEIGEHALEPEVQKTAGKK